MPTMQISSEHHSVRIPRSTPRGAFTRVVRPILPLFVIALLSGCAGSTRMTDVWKSPTWNAPPMKRVAVYVARKDPLRQRVWEDAVVAELKEAGVEAFPSYLYFADGRIDSVKARQLLLENRIDGFVMIKNAGRRSESYYVPGTTRREPAGWYRDPFWGTWTQVYREISTPGYTETETVASYDAYVFRTRAAEAPPGEDNLVWSARTEAVDPRSPKDAGQRVARQIVPALRKAGIL